VLLASAKSCFHFTRHLVPGRDHATAMVCALIEQEAHLRQRTSSDPICIISMAADTRDDASPQGEHTSHGDTSTQVPYQGNVYEVFDGHPATPPDSANILPGGAANTAGGRQKDASLIDALRIMKLSDFTEVHKKPCGRESLMTGIVSAFGVGGFRAVLGGMHCSLTGWFVVN